MYVQCTLYKRHGQILPFSNKSLSEFLGRIKLHKKDSINIFFLLNKVIAKLRTIFQYCVSKEQ